MAELASGAVSALLGVIRNEAQLLTGVEGDMQFIREEMESMNSFLMHLARTAPPSGEHDEQVRTWMNQVRLLAQDCNTFIDLYLYRGNRDIHRARGGLRRHLWWAYWLLEKWYAQHRAGEQLRQLKERARDVGKRRLRYGVEIPTTTTTGAQPPPGPAGAGHTASAKASAPAAEAGSGEEDDEDGGVDRLRAKEVDRLLDAQDLEEYFKMKLAGWIKELKESSNEIKEAEGSSNEIKEANGRRRRRRRRRSNSKMEERPNKIPSIAIVAPDNTKDSRALAHQALATAKALDFRTVMVDIPKVHYHSDPLLLEDILCYMWRELELEHVSSSSQQQGKTSNQSEGEEQHTTHWKSTDTGKWNIYYGKLRAIRKIIKHIQETIKFGDKMEKIKSEIEEVTVDDLELDLRKAKDDNLEKRRLTNQSLAVHLMQLNGHQTRKKEIRPKLCQQILKEAAKKLKRCMETEEERETGAREVTQIRLQQDQFEDILREVFLQNQQQDTTTASTSAMSEDQIKVMIREAKQEAKQEILEAKKEVKQEIREAKQQAKQEILEAKKEAKEEILLKVKKFMEVESDKEQTTGKPNSEGEIPQGQTAETKANPEKTQGQMPKSDIAETKDRIEEIRQKIVGLMKIKGIMDKIGYYLKDQATLIILNIGRLTPDYALRWEEARKALSLLDSVTGAVIVTVSRDIQRVKEFCSPPLDPMEYSLVGLYHEIVLELTRNLEQIDEEGDSHINYHVFRDILDECGPYEFSMKIFAHALYANPKRSREELQKLHQTMKQVAPKSFGLVAKKMLKFSYGDLPKAYKTCLLYLAIFPRGCKIRRSTLIGRWVVEGLITTKDWRWHDSVQEAERCFDVLVDRWLVYPADISAAGKVKSCAMNDVVHEFITKIAKKQRILETRLSQHLAHHFSISNDLHLRSSDNIDKFLIRLHESSHLSVLKVLDLEGCHCFNKKQDYLTAICNKILLLKYLSLRRTDVTWLPHAINKLHELEVLDIQETKLLQPNATRHVHLLKLKRLLGGQTDPSPSSGMTTNGIRIPDKIEKMLGMEVLSHVNGNGHHLKDIRNLWQLRKLGVVIEDNDDNLKTLLQTISDLHECLRSLTITLHKTKNKSTISDQHKCLRSLTITLPTTRNKSTSSTEESSVYDFDSKKPLPELESLRIRGTTQKEVKLLPLLVKKGHHLAKVTLSNTRLEQKDLEILADLPKLQYLKLRRDAYSESELTIKEKFLNLKYILVEGSRITDISFDGGALGIEKIVLPFTVLNLNGIQNLNKLEELELNNNNGKNRSLSIFKDAKQIAKVTLCGSLLNEDELRSLAKESDIRCLMLLENSYDGRKLYFKKDDFPKLHHLIVNCSKVADISFDRESAPKINKIVWSFKEMESLTDINHLQRLRALEFSGDFVPAKLAKVKEDIKKHKNKPYFVYNTPENQDVQTTNEEEKDTARFLCCKY